ncbi:MULTISPECIES: hypothetical protein [unclassified Streptomyces]|uniref:hypothetical protein n=1 Tax=unclassified Streptomyces TaxID=2593676 RepID=UPI0022505549|nr:MULTISPECIES: hypothetical protein [unclassified Streptomyces]MCX4827626.1 hypothetical protein [Streptomyces sp. NBC_01016]
MKPPVLEFAVPVVLAVVVGAVGIVIGGGWGLTLGGGALYLVVKALLDALGFGLWRRRHSDKRGDDE